MMGIPVVIVESGGVPYVQVESGPSFTVVDKFAPAITLVEKNAPPIALFNPDGTPYAGGGVQLGPELVPDPTFENDGNWDVQSGWAIVSGKLLATNADANTYTRRGDLVTAGKTYRISASAEIVSAGGFKLLLEGGANVFGDQNTVGVFWADVVATVSGGVYFWSNGGLTAQFDDLSVREVLNP